MAPNKSCACWVLVGVLFATTGVAEEFDYEIGLGLETTEFDGSRLITTPGGTVSNSSNIDSDRLSVFGKWYFDGLSDDGGPRARAEFIGRASFVGVSYLRSEQTVSTFLNSSDPAFPFPPVDSAFDSDGNSFAVDFRYVDRDSGWFGVTGFRDSNFTARRGLNESSDSDAWSLGVGKYLFDSTALSVNFSDIDNDGGPDASVIGANFTHLGHIGERWQYAFDLGYSRLDADSGIDLDTVGASFALYPTRDIEFGIRVEDVSERGTTFVDLDTTSVEGFASWYVTPNFKLSGHYSVDDAGYLGDVFIGGAPTVTDTDQDTFGISATIRF